jgi:enoyl-[acyl-carrier protein] reductase II
MLTLKQLMPVRMIKNKLYKQIAEAEDRGASVEELKSILGRARAKKGMFEGDLEDGELEIGQTSAFIHDIKPADQIVKDVWDEFLKEKERLVKMSTD